MFPLAMDHRGLAALTLLLTTDLAAAAPANFTIDPARSAVTLEGTVIGVTLQAQGDGSLTTQFEGTLSTELTDTTITFLNTGRIRARDNGSWEPNVDGAEGSAPANFAGRVANFLATAVAAARGLEFVASSPAIPRTATGFEAAGVAFQFAEGASSALDYRASGFFSESGRLLLTGLATNRVAGAATLTTQGDVETLTVPIETTFFFELLLPNDVQLTLKGQLVATRSTGGGTGNTFDDFIARRFPGVTDPAIIGPDADSDQDRLPNFVEFAFGLDPTTPNPDFAPLSATANPANPAERTLTFLRPAGLTGVDYRLEWANELTGWAPLDAQFQVVDAGNGQERVTATDTGAPGPAGTRFIRLVVSRP